MPFAKKTATLALSATLLLSAVPSALAADAPSAASSSAVAVPISAIAIDPVKAGPANDPAAASAAKISKEKAIELAKAAITLPEGYNLQGISFNSSSYQSNQGSWNMQFEKREQNRSLGGISATIDADNGKLLNYYSYENNSDRTFTYPPKVDLQSAKAMAQALLHKMNPDEEANVLYNDEYEKQYKQPLNGMVRYQIRFDRAVNGIPFPTNYITFTIDGDGRFVEYSYQMNDKVEFEDTKGVLSPEEAYKQYRAETKPSLLYVLTHPKTNNAPPQPMLSYTMAYNMLDAKTGKLLNQAGKPIPAQGAFTPLTEKPLASKPVDNQNLTKEQAAAQVTALFPLPAGATMQNSSYNENVDPAQGRNGSTWNFTWMVPGDKDKDNSYIRASVNSGTGEVLSYYKDQIIYYADKSADSAANPVTSETWNAAKDAAIAFVKKALPAYTSELAYDDQSMPNLDLMLLKGARTYTMPFKHLVNGVPTEFDSVSVGVNLMTAEVASFSNNMYNVAIPNDLGKQIEAEQAEDLLLSQYTLEKRYVQTGQSDFELYSSKMPMPPSPDGAATPSTPAKVVYVAVPKNPSEYVFLDALTGQWRSRDTGDVTNPNKVAATDLDQHWAQKELQLMIDYKAIDVQDGKVNPDQAIKRGEMIKMLITAMNGGYYTASYAADRKASFADVANGSQYFAYVESAVDANLIDRNTTTFNPESSMTRDEMAELLVRALGYSKLASTPGLFNLGVADAEAVQHKGHVAIVVSLGIMSATDGSFLPAAEVTRAQAATAFFRYLEKRAALQDTPIRNY